MTNPVLTLLFASSPCCGCCNGDEVYSDLVIEALSLTPEVEWPALDPLPDCFKRPYVGSREEVIRRVADARRRRWEA